MDQCFLQWIALGVLGLTSHAATAQLSVQDPQEQLNVLREQLDHVEAVNAEVRLELDAATVEFSDGWMDEQRAAQIASIVQEILHDADTRTSLRGSGMMMGWSDGFFLASADGQYKLKISGLSQTRFLGGWVGKQSLVNISATQKVPDPNYKKWTAGVEQTRTRLNIAGVIGDPQVDFLLQVGYAREDEDNKTFNDSSKIRFDMRQWNAWIRMRLSDDISIKAGIFTLPFTRESLVSPQNQLVLEKSLVDHRYGLGISQGVELTWASHDRRFFLAFTDGSHAIIHGIVWQMTEPPPWAAVNKDTAYAVTIRHEWKLLGDWEQFGQFTSPPGSERGILLGLAGHRQLTEEDDPSPFESNPDSVFWGLTGDISLQYDGASLFASAFYHRITGLINTNQRMDIHGFVVQGSTYLTNQTELYARWETGQPDGPPSFATDTQIVTVGVNHYVNGQDIKLSADIGFDFGEVTSFMQNDQTGWQFDDHRRDQAVFRSQLQLMF